MEIAVSSAKKADAGHRAKKGGWPLEGGEGCVVWFAMLHQQILTGSRCYD